MDVRDGFILGIDTYCDRWCEHCAFTSRCRAFADCAQLEATLDPALKAVTDALPLAQDIPPPPPPWMLELIDEMNERAAEFVAEATLERLRPTIAPEHEPIETRARAYSDAVHDWLESRGAMSKYPPTDPREVITWFQYSIPAKMHRAFRGLAADDPEERDWPADHDGSAKVALLGIERSHAAWLELVQRGLAAPSEIEPFVAELIWLCDELERVFPRARSFVRPGFDEPDEVARLLATEGCGGA